jgi:hypothetical protein
MFVHRVLFAGLFIFSFLNVTVTNADIFVDLNGVTTDSNLTLLCVETMQLYGVNVDPVSYCENPVKQQVMHYTERVATQPGSHIVWVDFVLYKEVVARDILFAFPTALNTSLTLKDFFTFTGGEVNVVTDVGKNEGIVLGCSIAYIVWGLLNVLLFWYTGAM